MKLFVEICYNIIKFVTIIRKETTMNYGQIGLIMRARREELGMSMRELAKKVGTSPSTVRAWELGDIESLKTTKLKAIAAALDMSVERLLGLEEHYVPIPGLRPVPIAERGDLSIIIKDQAMINARIYPRDEVFIRSQSNVNDGELAAVQYEGEVIIRRIYHYPDRLELRAENPIFDTIRLEGPDRVKAKIIGKAVSLLGDLK